MDVLLVASFEKLTVGRVGYRERHGECVSVLQRFAAVGKSVWE